MENKINIAELLKNCPKGMELDCTMFDNVTFVRVDNNREQFPVEIAVGGLRSKYLTKEGCFHDTTLLPEAKCVIFPKGKTTWEGFVPPHQFKDGDVVYIKTKGYNHNEFIITFKEIKNDHIHKHVCLAYQVLYISKNAVCHLVDVEIMRLATEEEKQKLFDAIKANGYKWNTETKTLEKLVEPKFKVGDRVKHVSAHTPGVVLKVGDKGYYIDFPKNGGVRYISFTLEKDYELAPSKFDINTLVPFEDKVLVRNAKNQRWIPAFWGYKVIDGFITTFGWCKYCIPYKGNENLFKTNNDCDDFYKTWKLSQNSFTK